MTTRPDTLQLGLYQHAGSSEGLHANLTIVEQAAADAADQGVELLVFPECFLTGYWRADPAPTADRVDQRIIDRLADCSRKTGVALVVGSYERRGDAVINSALCLTPQEGCVARYGKRALYGDWEQRVFAPGGGPTLFRYRGFEIGLLICFDVEYPELARDLACRGADLVVTPTALMEPYAYIADILVPARAIENQIFLAYANRVGIEGPFHYVGRSSICGPTGKLAGSPGDENGHLVTATLDKSTLRESRSDVTYITSIPEI